MPQSFHQITLWQDSFSCLLNPNHPILDDFSLESYLSADHIWVSKTGMGVGVGVDPSDVQRLGWVIQRSHSWEKSGESGCLRGTISRP